jgi:hypothetical protein
LPKQNVVAQIGVQIMDMNSIQHMFSGKGNDENETNPQNMVYFCKRMLSNFFNYASSFVVDVPNGCGGSYRWVVGRYG